jgi:hypothetical protein
VLNPPGVRRARIIKDAGNQEHGAIGAIVALIRAIIKPHIPRKRVCIDESIEPDTIPMLDVILHLTGNPGNQSFVWEPLHFHNQYHLIPHTR